MRINWKCGHYTDYRKVKVTASKRAQQRARKVVKRRNCPVCRVVFGP